MSGAEWRSSGRIGGKKNEEKKPDMDDISTDMVDVHVTGEGRFDGRRYHNTKPGWYGIYHKCRREADRKLQKRRCILTNVIIYTTKVYNSDF